MADVNKLAPIIAKWEGGYVNDPLDRGGATNMGVTLTTFRSFYGRNKTADDLRHITMAQMTYILKKGYWDAWKADQIENQSLANILVDFAWGSGTITSIKKIQRTIGLTPDGIVGNKTLAVLNGKGKAEMFAKIKAARLQFVQAICERNPSQVRFLRGWQNRINSYNYEN